MAGDGAHGRLAEFVPYLLSITSNAVSQRIADEYHSRFGLRIAEWRVMAVLGDVGSATQRALTELTLMDKVAVNRACKVLEQRKLVAREPHGGDGRSHLLALTTTGRALHGEIMPLATALEQRLLVGFNADERAHLVALLERLRQASES